MQYLLMIHSDEKAMQSAPKDIDCEHVRRLQRLY